MTATPKSLQIIFVTAAQASPPMNQAGVGTVNGSAFVTSAGSAAASGSGATQNLPPLNPPSGKMPKEAFVESKMTLALKRADQLDKMLAARIGRSVDTENVLIKMSKGELPPPTEKDCLIMALRLATPKKDWSETVKNHIWGVS